jgi:hypothetical protein
MLYQTTGTTQSQFSASLSGLSTGFAPFTALSPPAGPLTTMFFVTSDGTLLWANNRFYGGGASWCTDDITGQLMAVFISPSQFQTRYPNGCTLVVLTAVSGELYKPPEGGNVLIVFKGQV